MSSSGSFKTSAYDGRYLLFEWNVSNQNIQNNTTTISWTLSGAGTASVGYYKAGNFKVVIDGKTVYSSTARINLYNGITVKSGTYTFTHNSDGSRSFSASAQAGIYTTAANCTGSDSFALPAIPRASTILSASGNKITDNFSVKYSKAVSTYNDTLQINVYGRSVSQEIMNYASGSTFSLSDAVKKDISSVNSQNVYIEFQLVTYNGSSKIGTSDIIKKSVTVNDYQPTIGDISYSDTNSKTTAITGDSTKIIQGYSTVRATVTNIKTMNGATISKVTSKIGDVTNETTISPTSSSLASVAIDIGAVNVSEDSQLVIMVTDSRGLTATSSVTVTACGYEKPNANISCKRRENFYADTYLIVNPYISDIFGGNSATIKASYKQTDATSYGSEVNVPTDGITLSLDNTKAWNVKIVVSDKLSSFTNTLYIEKGIPIIFFDRQKSSVGVNCFPTKDNSFEVDGKTIDDYIFSRVQAGTVSFNCTENTMVTQEVTFPRAFSGKPRICLTANALSPQVTHLAFVGASTSGFTLKYQSTIARNPAYVDWIAILDDNSKGIPGE